MGTAKKKFTKTQSKTGSKWSNKEEIALINFVGKKNTAYIANFLKRTAKSIQRKAESMGLSTRIYR